MQKQKKQKGFSLIEVVVVTAIIAIMTSVLLVSMTQGRASREVEVAGRGLASALRQIQNSALTGTIVTPDHFPCQFTLAVSGSEYNMDIEERLADGDCSGSISTPIGSYKFERFVTLDESASTVDTAQFTVPFGTAFVSNNGSSFEEIDGMRQFVISKGDVSFYVCIYPSGQIEESKVACES